MFILQILLLLSVFAFSYEFSAEVTMLSSCFVKEADTHKGGCFKVFMLNHHYDEFDVINYTKPENDSFHAKYMIKNKQAFRINEKEVPIELRKHNVIFNVSVIFNIEDNKVKLLSSPAKYYKFDKLKESNPISDYREIIGEGDYAMIYGDTIQLFRDTSDIYGHIQHLKLMLWDINDEGKINAHTHPAQKRKLLSDGCVAEEDYDNLFLKIIKTGQNLKWLVYRVTFPDYLENSPFDIHGHTHTDEDFNNVMLKLKETYKKQSYVSIYWVMIT
jgi:hypothetical protein